MAILPMFLAQSSSRGDSVSVGEAVRNAFQRMDVLNHPDQLLNGLSELPMVLAGVFVIVGLLCILNGYKWHRWVVVILAFLGGLLLGNLLVPDMQRPAVVAISVGALCAIIATPLLKVAVAVFGGLTGAFIGANAWTALNAANADTYWAGAAMGFIVLAMASFLLFRIVIVLFTSVGGAAMLVFGGITLLMRVPGWDAPIEQTLMENNLVIPLLLAVTAVGGFVLQSSWHPETIKQANSSSQG
jgi:hypothetical protein